MLFLARLLAPMLVFAAALTSANAELSVGATAPPIAVKAALGGKDIDFVLSDALKKGPVVVYFYPKSFTSVCTEEAHLFAEATPELDALGASVIGISTDTIETQREFSRLECRDRFPVAADPDGAVARAYEALRSGDTARVMATRTSYVIGVDGKIASTLTASDAQSHIARALEAVKALQAARKS